MFIIYGIKGVVHHYNWCRIIVKFFPFHLDKEHIMPKPSITEISSFTQRSLHNAKAWIKQTRLSNITEIHSNNDHSLEYH